MIVPDHKPSQSTIARRFGSEGDVEALTGINKRTLQKWRMFGKGPRFYRAGGMVRYDLAEVEDWLRATASDRGHAA